DLDLEVALVLVEIPQLLDRALHVDRVVDAPELDVDLVLQRVSVFLLVADEIDVADEGALGYREDDPHAALEVLDPQLDAIEEAETEDGAECEGGGGRGGGGGGGGGGPGGSCGGGGHRGGRAPRIPLDGDFPDDDGGGGGLLPPRCRWDGGARRENKDGRETHPARCRQ